MSNLLDKASIVLTPTAYDNSKVLCVKPSDGSGDFDFSRNSAATRVNAQGLVEDVQILSSNLIVNGDFSNGATGWELAGAANVSNGAGNFTGSGGKILQRPNLTQGKFYRIIFDILNYTSGTSRVYLGSTGGASFTATANGTYSVILEAEGTSDVVQWRSDGGSTFIGSIDNCSVKEITDDTNLPRINYEGGCGSWLFEPQSTNLIPYSEDFNKNIWLHNSSLNITSNATTSPSGETNATSVNNSGGGNRLGAEIALTSGNDYTFSFYMKNNGGNASFVATFDGQAASQFYTITNDWARYELTFTATITETSQIRLMSGVSNVDAFVWGAQVEEQSFATSYIPTDGTSVTRNQDVCDNGGSLASINSTEGVLYAEIAALADDAIRRTITISNGTTSNRIVLRYDNVSNRIQGFIQVGGSTNGNINTTSFTITNFLKIAYKWKAGNFALWVNGTEVGTSTDTTSFAPDVLETIEFNFPFAQSFFGKTKAFAVWKEALTDAELTSLTTI